MPKSVHRPEYRLFLLLLRNARQTAGLTQDEVAVRIAQTQSYVSKCELGERRIDIIELNGFCRAYGLPLTEFVAQLEHTLAEQETQ